MNLGRALLLVVALGGCTPCASAADLFVDSLLGADTNDGLSWASAKASVTAALDVAIATPEADVVTVAGGTYRERLVMPPDVTLIGSVPSGGGAQDLDAHPSILDGEFGGRVVQFGRGTDASTLDGFVVTRGAWSDPITGTGGAGINVLEAGPSILRCRIEGNRGDRWPGLLAVKSSGGSSPLIRIEGCLVRNNVTTGRWSSPAVSVTYAGTPPFLPLPTLLKNCIIEDNLGGDGLSTGGLYVGVNGARLTLEHLVVRGNAGEGAYILAAKGATLTNCEFSGNEMGGLRLLLTNGGFSQPPVEHSLFGCTFQSGAGPALVGQKFTLDDAAVIEIRRCIIDGDGSEIQTTAPGEGPGGVQLSRDVAGITAILNNLIRNCPPSLLPTNIDVDPEFATGPLGESYLSQVAAGQISTSTAVDNGDVTASSVGMDALFTRTDAATDMGDCDLGVHYGFMPAYGPFVERLWIFRSDRPDALALVTEVPDLPWVDAPGTLSDPLLPLLYYRVDYPLTNIHVSKDLGTDSLRLAF